MGQNAVFSFKCNTLFVMPLEVIVSTFNYLRYLNMISTDIFIIYHNSLNNIQFYNIKILSNYNGILIKQIAMTLESVFS